MSSIGLVERCVPVESGSLLVALGTAVDVIVKGPGVGASSIIRYKGEHPDKGRVLVGPSAKQHQSGFARRRVEILTGFDGHPDGVEGILSHKESLAEKVQP
jgi:hypothetical protein